MDSRGQVPKNWRTLLAKIEARVLAENLSVSHRDLLDLIQVLGAKNMTMPEAVAAVVSEIRSLRSDRDNQARTISGLTKNQDAQNEKWFAIRARLLMVMCENPNRAGSMTIDEVVDLLKSKIAALALNLSLPETATLNTIVGKIQGMTPSLLILAELASVLYLPEHASVNEAMRRATDKIKALRDLLNS